MQNLQQSGSVMQTFEISGKPRLSAPLDGHPGIRGTQSDRLPDPRRKPETGKPWRRDTSPYRTQARREIVKHVNRETRKPGNQETRKPGGVGSLA